jgi:hypothetical protein
MDSTDFAWVERECGAVWKKWHKEQGFRKPYFEGLLSLDCLGIKRKIKLDLMLSKSRWRNNLEFRIYIGRRHKLKNGPEECDEPLSMRECGALFKQCDDSSLSPFHSGYVEVSKMAASHRVDRFDLLMFQNDYRRKPDDPDFRFYIGGTDHGQIIYNNKLGEGGEK